MLPCSPGRLRQPVRAPTPPAPPGGARGRPRHAGRVLGCRARRGRVHRRRHRGRQPGRARCSAPAGAEWRWRPPSSTTPCSTRRTARWPRWRRSTIGGSSTSTPSPSCSTRRHPRVSVMLANNEVGVVQPLDEVAEAARADGPRRCCTPTPCRPSRGSTSPRLAAAADLSVISAHKFGGPKGVGALVVRTGVDLEPRLLGGGQERERRSGTHNVAGGRGHGRRPADHAGAARRRASGSASCATGSPTACRGRARPRRDPWTAGPIADGRHCHVCIEGVESEALLVPPRRGPGSTPRRRRRAPAAPWSRPTCSPPWASPRTRDGLAAPLARLETTDADVDAALDAVPPPSSAPPGAGEADGEP